MYTSSKSVNVSSSRKFSLYGKLIRLFQITQYLIHNVSTVHPSFLAKLNHWSSRIMESERDVNSMKHNTAAQSPQHKVIMTLIVIALMRSYPNQSSFLSLF